MFPYYFHQDAAGAIKFFQRKVDFLTDQMEKIQPLATEKNKLRESKPYSLMSVLTYLNIFNFQIIQCC